ncbi:MAG: SH3 domain-containing protein [Actinomycetota bacterium]
MVAMVLLATGCGAGASQPTAPRALDSMGGVAPAEPTSATTAGADTDPAATDDAALSDRGETGSAVGARSDLRWTVVAVERSDVLNVRAEPSPSAPIVDTLAPWTTDVDASDETAQVGEGQWRRITTADGETGWVNSRFLVAQPHTLSADDELVMATLARELAEWTVAGTGERPALFAPRALWIGGLTVYGDGHLGWNWFPGDTVDEQVEWDQVRTLTLTDGVTEIPCGADCDRSLNESLQFDRVTDEAQYLVNDVTTGPGGGFYEGELFAAPELHRVVIDVPTTDPDVAIDWKRIHVVFDWSGGQPQVLLIHSWGWTP